MACRVPYGRQPDRNRDSGSAKLVNPLTQVERKGDVMNKKESLTHQMLTSVASFIAGNVCVFPKNSSKIQETFASEVEDLNGLTADYVAAETAARVARQARDSAFETLKSDLEGAALLVAALDNQTLVLPRSGSMSKLVHTGRAFLEVADSMKKEFIEHG